MERGPAEGVASTAPADTLAAPDGYAAAGAYAERAADTLNGRRINSEPGCDLAHTRPSRGLSQCRPNGVFKFGWNGRPTQALALAFGSRQPGSHSLLDHGALELGENAHHLKHGLAARRRGVETLLTQEQVDFYQHMDSGGEAFPNDIAALKAALAAARDRHIIEAARAAYAEAELAVARAKASDDQALIAHQQLRIEKLTRELYGPRSERTSRLLDQIELQFEELESSATEDEIAAEMAVAKTTTVAAFTRKRPARKPFPEHLPRERVIVPGPTACLCCGGGRLRKLGETVTETLELIPRQWKVIQHVREKFTCRDCEKISQAPAPFHVIATGLGRPQSAGDDPVREVRAASAAQPPGRTLCQGRRAAELVDPG